MTTMYETGQLLAHHHLVPTFNPILTHHDLIKVTEVYTFKIKKIIVINISKSPYLDAQLWQSTIIPELGYQHGPIYS
jgi:hypothetical protein